MHISIRIGQAEGVSTVPLKVTLQNVGTMAQVRLTDGWAQAVSFGDVCLMDSVVTAPSSLELEAFVAPCDYDTVRADIRPLLCLNGVAVGREALTRRYEGGVRYEYEATVDVSGGQGEVEYGVNFIKNGNFDAAKLNTSSIRLSSDNAEIWVPGWMVGNDSFLYSPDHPNSYTLLRQNDVYALLMSNDGVSRYSGGNGAGLQLKAGVNYVLSCLYCSKTNNTSNLVRTIYLTDEDGAETDIDTDCMKATVTLTENGSLDRYESRPFRVEHSGRYSLVWDVRYAVAITGLRLEAVP